MIWALLGILLFGGGGGNSFGEKMFGKGNQKLVREVVSDPSHADAAVLVLKQGDKDLKAVAKELGKIAKAFRKADEAQTAGVDELNPFVLQAAEQRRIAQQKSLDRIFELKRALTEKEWGQVFAKLE